jgi:hypothetical protein
VTSSIHPPGRDEKESYSLPMDVTLKESIMNAKLIIQGREGKLHILVNK